MGTRPRLMGRIAENAGHEGSVVYRNVLEGKGNDGFNAGNG
jgi:hypothetical protein